MKILLTTLNSKFIHSSLALRYLNGYCQDELYDLHIEEYSINNNMDYVLGEIYKKGYDLVCFSTYIWNVNEILQISQNLKKVDKNIKVLLGGPEVSYDPMNIMEKNQHIDFIVQGEGELTLKNLLKALTSNYTDLSTIDGLVYRVGDIINVNNQRCLIDDLDIIPFPYSSNFEDLNNKIIYYESTRGCPFNCQYCLSSAIKGVRSFSLDRVKEDLQKFVNGNIKQVKFVDRTFNANKHHALEIMKYISEIDNGKINFHFEMTASLIDEEMLEFLRDVRTGLFQFEIGIQSTNEKTLNEIKRNVNFPRLKKVCEQLANYKNIHIHLDLIAGLPYEDFNTFLESFDDVYKLKPEMLQLGFLKLLKGSGIRENNEKYGYEYKSTPPYEVLENDYISYSEMLKLKGIEEMVETYYNSHGFNYSIGFILHNHYENPSIFYKDLADYWESKNHHHVSHRKDDSYGILLDFYKESELRGLDVFKELLKFDYLRGNRGNLPSFLEEIHIEDFKNRCHKFLQDESNINKYLSGFIGQSAKKIIKKVHFEVFKYDIFKIKSLTDNIPLENITVLFNYDVDENELDKSIFHKINI